MMKDILLVYRRAEACGMAQRPCLQTEVERWILKCLRNKNEELSKQSIAEQHLSNNVEDSCGWSLMGRGHRQVPINAHLHLNNMHNKYPLIKLLFMCRPPCYSHPIRVIVLIYALFRSKNLSAFG